MIVLTEKSKILKTTVTYKGNGTQTNFDFPFDYLRKSFVKVTIDDKTVTEFSVDNRTVRFDTPPKQDSIIVIYRETSTERLVSWADASVLKAADMTISQVQQLHIIEEQQDWTITNSMVLNASSEWEGRNHRIANILDPTAPQDVVTKNYMETVQGGFVQENTELKNEATKQAQIATTKANEADVSAKAAKVSETNAKASELAAKASQDAAKVSEDKAKTSETNALTHETNAKASADKAKVSETNAGASASTATTKASQASVSATNAQKAASQADASAVQAGHAMSTAATKAEEASVSAANAKTSETNAKTSETNAKASETNAKTSETNAGKSATDATTKAGEASASATNAKASETAAKVSETNAKSSEGKAKTSETNAGVSATTATQQATKATTEANRAKTEADRAKTAADSVGNPVVNITQSNGNLTITKGDGSSNTLTVTPAVASLAEAEAGTDNTKMMTPLRVAQVMATGLNNVALLEGSLNQFIIDNQFLGEVQQGCVRKLESDISTLVDIGVDALIINLTSGNKVIIDAKQIFGGVANSIVRVCTIVLTGSVSAPIEWVNCKMMCEAPPKNSNKDTIVTFYITADTHYLVSAMEG